MSRDDEETRAEDKDAYFVSYREVKVGKRVKVYLTKGGPDARRKQKPEEVLAAVGEDSGPKTGARFRNAANFTEHGHLDSDSRREVSEWLDGIVAEGLAREAAAGAGEGSDDTPFGGTPVASGVDSNRAPAGQHGRERRRRRSRTASRDRVDRSSRSRPAGADDVREPQPGEVRVPGWTKGRSVLPGDGAGRRGSGGGGRGARHARRALRLPQRRRV